MIQITTGPNLKVRPKGIPVDLPEGVELTAFIQPSWNDKNEKSFPLMFYFGGKSVAIKNDSTAAIQIEISNDSKNYFWLKGDSVKLKNKEGNHIYTEKPDFTDVKNTEDYALVADQFIYCKYLISLYPFLSGKIKSIVNGVEQIIE